jgi:methylenetetrahydrofolate dehydrogenase (NADP+)/methenyltetrahydrofolate cyclohydrolase
MSAQILDGKAIAADVRAEVAAGHGTLGAGRAAPGLAVVLVGENPASQVYVRNKRKACARWAFTRSCTSCRRHVSQAELLALVDRSTPTGHRRHPGAAAAAGADRRRGGDRAHPARPRTWTASTPTTSAGCRCDAAAAPLHAQGRDDLLARTGQSLEGLDAVVIGQSNIVGRPMALELLAARCTITVCHSRTKDLADKARAADVLVVAIGRARLCPATGSSPARW